MSKERHINELLKEQEFSKIAEIIKSKSRNTEGILYPNSPLNKAPETYLFEKIVHQVIEDFDKDSNDRKINFVKDQNQNTIIKIKEDLANSTEFLELQNKLSWNKGRSEINLKELLEKTNFNHLELDKEDIEHYAKLTNILKLERITSYYHYMLGTDFTYGTEVPTYEEFIEKIQEKDKELKEKKEPITNLDRLEYGEMLAINRYTYHGDYYTNTLLRDANTLSIYSTPMAIIDSAIAAHALNKLPDTELPYVIRYETNNRFSALTKNIEEKRITQEKGFLSTSKQWGDLKGQDKDESNNKIIFYNIKGKNITPLSQVSYEEEYLIPPSSKVEWLGFHAEKDEQGKDLHVFIAKDTNILLEQFQEINKLIPDKDKINLSNPDNSTKLATLLFKDKIDFLPFTTQSFLADEAKGINNLFNIDFPVSKLLEMPQEQAYFFISNNSKLKSLKENDLPVSKLLEMPFDQAQDLIKYAKDVEYLKDIRRCGYAFVEYKLDFNDFVDKPHLLDIKKVVEKPSDQSYFFLSS